MNIRELHHIKSSSSQYCWDACSCRAYRGSAQQKTYCNPVNIDYGYTPFPSFVQWGKHRATADPVIVNYKGDFYLYSTNQWGYWWSSDMLNWKFVLRKFLRPWNHSNDELCAPAVGIIGDTMIVFGSSYTKNFTLWMSTNPKANEWKPLVDSFEIGGWDPAFFTDDDGRLYMYNGSSNTYPVYGVELDRTTFKPIGTRTPMYLLEDWRYGWQRFGENMDNTFLDPFIEGAWMTKHNGKYYFQYDAPGTEMSGYADTRPIFKIEEYSHAHREICNQWIPRIRKRQWRSSQRSEGPRCPENSKGRRSAYIKWSPEDNAFAYNLYYGTAPDKLYSCIMVHDINEYWFKAMDSKKTYYFAIEAVNENGVSERTKVLEIP